MMAGAGSPKGQQAWTSASSYTFTVPAGVSSVCILCVGGGGGGAGSEGEFESGAGGGGGALSYSNAVAVTPGEGLAFVVGAAGSGGSAGWKYGTSPTICPQLAR
jgi:hypothetical protein